MALGIFATVLLTMMESATVDWSLRYRTDEWVESTIEISDKGVASDVVLNVQFSHPVASDLEFRLVGPTGTEVDLSPDLTPGTMLLSTMMEELTVTLEGLDDFCDEIADGTWRLQFRDEVGNRYGVLRAWSLDIASKFSEIPLQVENQPLGSTDVTLDVRLLPSVTDGLGFDLWNWHGPR